MFIKSILKFLWEIILCFQRKAFKIKNLKTKKYSYFTKKNLKPTVYHQLLNLSFH
jgi:hypothetical protein